MLTVLIVEDEPLVREHLHGLVGGLLPDAEVMLAGCVKDGLACLDRVLPALALIDMRLPDGHGIEVITEINRRGTQTACMVMSSLSDANTVLDAIDAGAIGYLLKGASDPEILAALRSVLEGGSPIDPRVAREVLARARANGQASNGHAPSTACNNTSVGTGNVESASPQAAFTPKEISVLEHVARGMSHKQVAMELGVERCTVESHTRSIYRKLAVRSRMQAVLVGRQQGLIA